MARIVAETERLRLREWDAEDEERFYLIMNRPEVMRYLGGVQTREEWNAAFQRVTAFQRDCGHTFWIVDDRQTDDILGFCGVKLSNAPGAGSLLGKHEIGWRLRPEAWGKGIAKEAAVASMDLAFDRFGAPEVIATTLDGNVASQGLMKRLGMTRREDLDYVDTRFGPEMNPSIVYVIEAGDRPAARLAALS